MKKRIRIAMAIAFALAFGNISAEAGLVEEVGYGGGNTGYVILDCNVNGCAAATSCSNTNVGVTLEGYYDDENGVERMSMMSSYDYQSVVVALHNDQGHTYTWARSYHFVGDYLYRFWSYSLPQE
ncbi:MAG: hypothetical protein IJ773_08685 [Lachnospiraceae bacterium]|nr:hypothetical protein [Lachnospiraceae bacterium]